MMTNPFDLTTQFQNVTSTFWNNTEYHYEVSPGRLANLKTMHKAQYDRAVERYRAALQGKGWRSTRQVECLLGVAETIANAFLRKLLSNNLIERRPRGGNDNYVRSQGWEWQWKQ